MNFELRIPNDTRVKKKQKEGQKYGQKDQKYQKDPKTFALA